MSLLESDGSEKLNSQLGEWKIDISGEAENHKEFLLCFIKNFSDAVSNYTRIVSELPLSYHELSTQTYITIALSKISPAIMNELFFDKKNKKRSANSSHKCNSESRWR